MNLLGHDHKRKDQRDQTPITLQNHAKEEVKSFSYLGSEIEQSEMKRRK